MASGGAWSSESTRSEPTMFLCTRYSFVFVLDDTFLFSLFNDHGLTFREVSYITVRTPSSLLDTVVRDFRREGKNGSG